MTEPVKAQLHLAAFIKARLGEDEAAASEETCNRNRARLLREVKAKRAIVDECELLIITSIAFPGEAGPESAVRILRHMAAIWIDHPDYQQEWTMRNEEEGF